MIDWTQMRSAAEVAAEAEAIRRAEIGTVIDGHVDAVARARGYASAAQLASYAASTVEAWAAEAQAFVAWRDSVWLAAIPMIEAGAGVSDLLTALPAPDTTP